MTLLVSDVAQQVFAFLGRPPQSALPERDLIDCGSREVSAIIVDLLNTDRDYRVELRPVTPAGRDSLFVLGEIARLEARPLGSSDDDWVRWEKVPYASWDGEASRSRLFSIYGGTEGSHLVLSEDPTPYEFRALVESGSVTLSSLTDDTTLSGLVQPLLFTRWALSAGASVNYEADARHESWLARYAPKERQLRLDLPRLEQSWRRYLEGGRGEGTTFAEPFNSRRNWDEVDMYMDGSGRYRTT